MNAACGTAGISRQSARGSATPSARQYCSYGALNARWNRYTSIASSSNAAGSAAAIAAETRSSIISNFEFRISNLFHGSAASPNASCARFAAWFTSASSRITAILISEVEIIWILMPPALMVSKSFAATPEWDRMPIPTTLSFAMPSCAIRSTAPISFATGRNASSAFGSSSFASVKEMSVVPLTETFCTIISMTMFAPASAVKIRAAVPGLSGTWTMVTFAWLRSTLTPRMTTFSIPAFSSFTMVPGFWLKLLRTSKTTPNFFANSTERDCITFEPLLAISSISS